MLNSIINGLKLGILIIGTTIGAGFASGREVWEFFSSYGVKSTTGIFIFMAINTITSICIVSISYKHKTSNYYELLVVIMGRKLAKIFDIVIFFYLLSVSVVMFAGSGATLEQWNFPFVIGIIVLAIAIWIIIISGVEGLIKINVLFIPLLLIVILYVTYQYVFLIPNYSGGHIRSNLKVWPSAITYSALNAISLLGVLSTIGNKIKSRIEIFIGGIFGGLSLGVVALMLNLSILKVEYVQQYEIPLFSLISKDKMFLLLIASITIWLAIYTTALSNIYSLVTRIQNRWTNLSTSKITFIIILIIAPLSFFGFSILVNILYPLYGVISLYLMATILLYPFQN
ncbi:MAG: hypothetical protein AB7V16_08600 [Vulcanibacillus sp.]